MKNNTNENISNDQDKKGIIDLIKDFFKKHETLAEILRFLIIGGIATIIDFLVMGLVLYLFEPSLYSGFLDVYFGSTQPASVATIVSTGAGFISGLIFNYIFSIKFVYINKGNSKSTIGFLMFSVLSAIGLVIHLLGMLIGYDLLHINEWLVKIILTVIVLIYNYISKRLLIFKKMKKTE